LLFIWSWPKNQCLYFWKNSTKFINVTEKKNYTAKRPWTKYRTFKFLLSNLTKSKWQRQAFETFNLRLDWEEINLWTKNIFNWTEKWSTLQALESHSTSTKRISVGKQPKKTLGNSMNFIGLVKLGLIFIFY